MFGSFMPQFGRGMGKASAIFGNQTPGFDGSKQGGFGRQAGMNLGQMFGQGRQQQPNPFPSGFMGQIGNMGMQMGRALAPQQMPFQMPQNNFQQVPFRSPMQGGEMGGRLGELYKQGKIQTLGGNFGGFGLM